MVDRLVIPKALQTALQMLFHWGHPGHDETPRRSSEFCWLQIHHDVLLSVKLCKECTNAGKNFETIQSHGHYGKFPIAQMLWMKFPPFFRDRSQLLLEPTKI